MTQTKKPDSAAGGRIPVLPQNFNANHTNESAAIQRGRMLAELKQRTLTTLEARRELDVLHPAARVMELRGEGYPIETAWAYDVTSEGYQHRLARYQLTGERAQHELF